MTPTGFAKALSVCLLQWNDGPGAKPRTQGRGWARGRGPGPPPTPGAGATGPERLLPRGGGRSRAQIRCRCPIGRGEARVPTPETRPRRGQSTGPAVMRACRRARPGDGPAAAWGPGAGGLAAVSSPHLPRGTGGKCSALLHKRGRGLHGFPGSPWVPGEPPQPRLPPQVAAPSCPPPGPRRLSKPHTAESRSALEATKEPRAGATKEGLPEGQPAGPHPGAQEGRPAAPGHHPTPRFP